MSGDGSLTLADLQPSPGVQLPSPFIGEVKVDTSMRKHLYSKLVREPEFWFTETNMLAEGVLLSPGEAAALVELLVVDDEDWLTLVHRVGGEEVE